MRRRDDIREEPRVVTKNCPKLSDDSTPKLMKQEGGSPLNTDQLQRSQNVEPWNTMCIEEGQNFQQQASRVEYDFSKALQSTDHLGVPNPLRTAICFDVFARVGTKFQRFQNLTRATRTEFERAAYMNDPSNGLRCKTPRVELEGFGSFSAEALQQSLVRRAYFTELKEVLAKKASLEQRLSRLDSLHKFMLTRLRNSELMVDRLATRWGRLVMRQTLADWKKIIIRKKYTRVLLEKTRCRWTKQRLMRLFLRWNDYAAAEKIRKANEQIHLFRDSKHDFQELIGKLQVQIETSKLEMKAHREHLDLAKRHTLSLEELLAQLELRIGQSQERKLQAASNQWGKLCFSFVDCECDYLQNMLDAVSVEDYVDANALLLKGEDENDLLHMPSEMLVLRWINVQLEQCGASFKHFSRSSAELIQNFSSDMRCCYVLRHIINRLVLCKRQQQPDRPLRTSTTLAPVSRAAMDNASVSRQSPFPMREELRDALTEQLHPGCPVFLCDLVLGNEMAGDLMFCLFGFLVCEHPSLTGHQPAVGRTSNSTNYHPWNEAQVALDEARAIWDSVRLQWKELHAPFDVLEATNSPLEATTPPQLLAKANTALQNAVNTVQYVCSKRTATMRVWGCLQRRIQQDALRLLARRGRNQAPFALVDRRAWREKYMLTTLPTTKFIQMFMDRSDNKQTGDELADELQRTEEILVEHYEQLSRVYRIYANIDSSRVSSEDNSHRNGGSAVDEARFFHKISACMSLAEFYTLLKDCQVFGKTRPFPYDCIQSIFDKVSPEVSASMDTATLVLPLTHTVAAPAKEISHGREMTPAEFVEGLIHIVCSNRVQWKGIDVPPTARLAQRLRSFLEEIVFPNSMRPDEEKSSILRPQLLTVECREVFTAHHKKLRSIYAYFVAGGTKAEGCQEPRGSTKMLTANGFVSCCQHFDLFRDNTLHLDDIQYVLAETLQLERDSIHFDLANMTTRMNDTSIDTVDVSGDTNNGLTRNRPQHEGAVLLTLAEFMEALAAVACYLNPDVFIPLATRLDAFFSERLGSLESSLYLSSDMAT